MHKNVCVNHHTETVDMRLVLLDGDQGTVSGTHVEILCLCLQSTMRWKICSAEGPNEQAGCCDI
jgi:hypothetical protein